MLKELLLRNQKHKNMHTSLTMVNKQAKAQRNTKELLIEQKC